MEVFFNDFGVQPIYLAAQVVNFLILLFILKRFMYKPLLKVFEERKITISNNLKIAEQLEHQRQNIKEESDVQLKNASKEALEILAEASKTANQIVKDAHKKVENDIEVMLKKGKETLSQEREIMVQEVREELASLVVLGVTQVAGKVLNESDHKNIVSQTIKEIEYNSPTKNN